ncbi:MAG: PPC domain-containing protein [Gammaproteobacteria bacterium]|nr:PPC domain-containing protein [Gammaproteobacteria bacterium]MDH5652577.1 PPC domain-containing protein [Gammaproteobacteria bacterium]
MNNQNKWNKSTYKYLLSIFLYLISIHIYAAAPGVAFPVNTMTNGNQYLLDIGMDSSGRSIVLWQDSAQGNLSFMRRYTNDTPFQTSEWYVGSTTDTATDGAGNYVTVHTASDASGTGVYATVYDQYGNIIVNTFRVNSVTTGDQNGPTVTMNTSGEFAVVWTGYQSGVAAVYARKFHANGVPYSNDVMASSANGSSQYAMDIDMADNGLFAVSWVSFIPTGTITDVWGRRMSSTGGALGSAFRANTYTTSIQAGTSIALDASGNFIITWESYSQDGNEYGIYGQRYSSTGSKLGTEFRINNITTGSQQLATVGMAANGDFAVAWQHDNRNNDPSSNPSIQAREYFANGTPKGNQFQVSPESSDAKNFKPKIGMDGNGNFLIAWQKYNVPTAEYDVYARYYYNVPVTVLTNGVTVTNLSGSADSWQYFKITVPPGTSTMDVNMRGTTGDADLYIKYDSLPSDTNWDIRPWLNGSTELVRINTPPAGDFYIGINGYTAFSGVSLEVLY